MLRMVATPAVRWLFRGRERPLVLILAVALGLRLLWVLHAHSIPPDISDPQWYYAVATNVASGHGFTASAVNGAWVAGPGGNPTTIWPPGWPLSLSVAFLLFGASLTVAKLFNVVVGVIAIYLTFRIGEMAFSRRVGLLAATILALYPNSIIWSSTLYPDLYFTMWFSLAVFFLLRTREMAGRRLIAGTVLLGLVTGAATLVRGQGLLLLPLSLVFWFLYQGWRQAAGRTAMALAAAAVVILPWTVRNAVTFHAPILVSVNDGYNLRIGHSPYATGRFVAPTELWYIKPGISYAEREALLSSEGRKLAIEYAVSHPRREVVLSLKKLYFLAIPDSDSLDWAGYGPSRFAPAGILNLLSWTADGYYWALLLLATFGLVASWRLKMVRFIAVVLASWAVFHVVFFGEPRYHIPLLPLLALLAVLGIDQIRGLLSKEEEVPREERRATPV